MTTERATAPNRQQRTSTATPALCSTYSLFWLSQPSSDYCLHDGTVRDVDSLTIKKKAHTAFIILFTLSKLLHMSHKQDTMKKKHKHHPFWQRLRNSLRSLDKAQTLGASKLYCTRRFEAGPANSPGPEQQRLPQPQGRHRRRCSASSGTKLPHRGIPRFCCSAATRVVQREHPSVLPTRGTARAGVGAAETRLVPQTRLAPERRSARPGTKS